MYHPSKTGYKIVEDYVWGRLCRPHKIATGYVRTLPTCWVVFTKLSKTMYNPSTFLVTGYKIVEDYVWGRLCRPHKIECLFLTMPIGHYYLLIREHNEQQPPP